MLESKMETMTFAELRAVILCPDWLQIDLVMSSKTTPPSLGEFLLNLTLWLLKSCYNLVTLGSYYAAQQMLHIRFILS